MSPTSDRAQTELTSLPGSYEERYAEALQMWRRGELEQAAAICTRIIDRISRLPERRRPPDSPLDRSLLGATILLAELRAKQGDWAALDDLCTRAKATHAEYAHRWAIEPFMLRIQYGQPEQGIRGLQALAESVPDSFYLWRMLAQAALDVDDLELAMTASDHAGPIMAEEEDAEDVAAYHIVRFRLCHRRGAWHEAAREWRTACLWDDEMEGLREVVVRMFLASGHFDDALDYVDDEMLGATVSDYYRGWVASRRGDQVRARYLWRKIVERDPGKDDGPVVRALAYCYLRQPDAALAVLLEAMNDHGNLTTAEALALALAWAMHGDVEAARANVKLAIKRSAAGAEPAPLLSSLDWIEFEELVEDDAIKAALRPYFEKALVTRVA